MTMTLRTVQSLREKDMIIIFEILFCSSVSLMTQRLSTNHILFLTTRFIGRFTTIQDKDNIFPSQSHIKIKLHVIKS